MEKRSTNSIKEVELFKIIDNLHDEKNQDKKDNFIKHIRHKIISEMSLAELISSLNNLDTVYKIEYYSDNVLDLVKKFLTWEIALKIAPEKEHKVYFLGSDKVLYRDKSGKKISALKYGILKIFKKINSRKIKKTTFDKLSKLNKANRENIISYLEKTSQK